MKCATHINIAVKEVTVLGDQEDRHKEFIKSVLYSAPVYSLSLKSNRSLSTKTFNNSGSRSFHLK